MVNYTSPATTAISDTRPAESDGKVWVDTSENPPEMKLYDSATGAFIPASAKETIVSQTEPTPEVGKIWFEPGQNGIGVYKGLPTEWQFLELLSDIPDSAVRQWPFAQRSGSTIIENLANNDGTVTGSPTNTADSQFFDGYYESTDGSDDAIELPIGAFETQVQSEDFGLAFTVRSTGNLNTVAGATGSNFDNGVIITDTGSGGLEFVVNAPNAASLSTSQAVNDGSIRRLFFMISTNDPTNWSVYSNDTDVSGATSGGNTDLSSLSFPAAVDTFGFGARNFGGTIERFVQADLDHPILYESPTRQDVTNDFDLQPFS